jgi:membrane-bound serine protease (ClpP class)
MGIASIGASLFLSLVGETRFWSSEELWSAFTLVGLSLIVSAGLSAVILKTLPRTSLWDRVILSTEFTQTEGYASSPPGQDGLVGQRGVTLTYLRPAGMALVDGQRVNVVTEGTFIPQDTPVEVIATEGTRVVVREST